MKPSYPHAAPGPPTPVDVTVVGGPPASAATLISALPGAPLMKPTRKPSGEKNGLKAPSVPISSTGSSWSRDRTKRRPVSPTYTSFEPSGDAAIGDHCVEPMRFPSGSST